MKRRIGVLLAISLVLICAFALAEVEINEKSFPDDHFRTIVQAFDLNGDGILADAEIAAVKSMNCKEKSIASLTGIEHFTALITLDCSANQLSQLDVSKNAALMYLKCASNQLTALDVSKNVSLQQLECSSNHLTALDVSNNTMLGALNCSSNQLSSLDLSKNDLYTLECDGNQLTALDVSNSKGLAALDCASNKLTEIDLSKNKVLKQLDCHGNALTALDISSNTKLRWLHCYGNQIDQLNVLPVSALNRLVIKYSPVEKDGHLVWANAESTPDELAVDSNVTMITDTGLEINASNFPDDHFRNEVKNFDKNDDDLLNNAEIAAVLILNCKEKSIASLTGIEHFTALITLDCSGNQLSQLDVSKNTALTYLECASNQLTALDVSKNVSLQVLECSSNSLTALDVSNNTILGALNCSSNQLSSLDLSKNDLYTLECDGNQLTALDVSNSKGLAALDCASNRLTEINLSKNTVLKQLDCHGNALTALDVSSNAKLCWLHCHANRMEKLDISKNPDLSDLVSSSDPVDMESYYFWRDDGSGAGSKIAELTVDKTVDIQIGGMGIIRPDLSEATVKAIPNQTYTGKAIKPTVTVKYDGQKLRKGIDYTVAYKSNKKVGTATVILTGQGLYKGTKTVTFKIIPAGVNITSLTASASQLTVRWDQGNNITGYQIEYSLQKDFSNRKKVTVSNAETTEKNLKNLAAKTKYYVRIRTYKTVKDVKYYSVWSTAKSKKTK